MTGPERGRFAVVRTRGFAAFCIRVVTRSPVNHAIVCVGRAGADWQCVEARPGGAGFVHASAYRWIEWSDLALTDDQADAVAAWALAHVGTGYGYLDCVAAGLDAIRRRWWHRFPSFDWVTRRLASVDTMMCSQLVAKDYSVAGLTIVPGVPPYEVTPGELRLWGHCVTGSR